MVVLQLLYLPLSKNEEGNGRFSNKLESRYYQPIMVGIGRFFESFGPAVMCKTRTIYSQSAVRPQRLVVKHRDTIGDGKGYSVVVNLIILTLKGEGQEVERV